MNLRVTPFRKSAFRTTLVMGCDRELFLMSIPLFLVVGFLPMSLTAAVIAIALQTITFFSLKLMGRSDPQMRQIYFRYMGNYGQAFYPAQSTPFNTPRINLKR